MDKKDYNYALNFRKFSMFKLVGASRFLKSFWINPAIENKDSEGTDVDGTHIIILATRDSFGRSSQCFLKKLSGLLIWPNIVSSTSVAFSDS